MTSLIVLGLLIKMGAMSGYDIQMVMENSQTDKWAYVKPASIYYALKKLEEKGFVYLDGIETTGHRSKAVYSVTDSGKVEYRRLIKLGMEESSVIFPATLYSSLTFIDDIPATEAIIEIDKQLIKVNETYTDMKNIEALKREANAYPTNVEIIFVNMFAQCEIQINTLKQLKEHLMSDESN